MIDDTRDINGSVENVLQGDLWAEVLDLTQLRTDRNDAYKWSKDLKLLAFDDTDVAPQSQQAGGCVGCSKLTRAEREATAKMDQPIWICDGCATDQRLQERFHCNICEGGNYDICSSCVAKGALCKDASHKLSYVGAICEHLVDNSCQRCMLTPPFPASGTVQNFRLIHQSWLPHPERICTQFVAVSYCWPANKEDQSQGRYTVRDVNGKTRRNRAPEKIIDRAVGFARQSGYRFIWIDQECIDQDDAEEKSIAVASMDLVYSRAQCSIGLLDTVMDPIQTSIFSALSEWNQLRTEVHNMTGNSRELLVWSLSKQIISLFEMISQEKWCTRAWVLQEAFSAGWRMQLVFPVSNDSHSASDPGHVHHSDCLIFIRMDHFSECVGWAEEFFTRHFPQYLKEVRPSIGDFVQQNKDRIAALFQTLQLQFIRPRQKGGFFSQYVPAHYKRSCNAAAALSFLRYRDNTIVQDRVSIFANLCDYDYRLDLAEVGRRAYPLSASLIAISIINGDLSLLIPEVYDTKSNVSKSQLFSSRLQLRNIEHFSPNPAPLIQPQMKRFFSVLPDRRIAFPGLLWKVQNGIKLEWLRDIYVNAWGLLRIYASYFYIVEDKKQSMSHFIRPMEVIPDSWMQHPGMTDEVKSLVAELRSTGGAGWKPPFDRRELELQTFSLECTILMVLILFLRDSEQFGLADAIWNSTQGITWPIDGQFKREDDVPASVRDFPKDFPESLNVEELFNLEKYKRGGWLQSWIVWRIMTRGYLLYGNLVEKSFDVTQTNVDPGANDPKPQESETEEPETQEPETQEPETQEPETQEPETLEEIMMDIPKKRDGKRLGRYSQQLTTAELVRRTMQVVIEECGHKPNRDASVDDPGVILWLMKYLAGGEWKLEAPCALKGRCAFFDVDEFCLVLTPFQTSHDVLPRPETRSMSASWVVKRDLSPNAEEEEKAGLTESFKFVEAVKGMWAAGHHPIIQYAVSQ